MIRRAIERLCIGESLTLADGGTVTRTSNNRYLVEGHGVKRYFGGARASVDYAVSRVVAYVCDESPELHCTAPGCAKARRVGQSYCDFHYKALHAEWMRRKRQEERSAARQRNKV